jgi:hypothetical protein
VARRLESSITVRLCFNALILASFDGVDEVLMGTDNKAVYAVTAKSHVRCVVLVCYQSLMADTMPALQWMATTRLSLHMVKLPQAKPLPWYTSLLCITVFRTHVSEQ